MTAWQGLPRYSAAAASLRAFGLTPQTRRLYRLLGNRCGQARHGDLSAEEVLRGVWLWKAAEKAAIPLDASARVLELGTGWTHFYGLFLRLLFPVQLVLFDVQDCRQFEALRSRFRRLASVLDICLPEEYRERADEVHAMALEIASAGSLEDVYDRLGLEYVVQESGSLHGFADGEFSMIFSVDVLEHVARNKLAETIRSMGRILAPGGVSAHQIGIDDHLAHYAPGMSSKAYVRFSETAWRLFLENRLQYVNRVQACEFERVFSEAGFVLLEAAHTRDEEAVARIHPARAYSKFSGAELAITRARFVHGVNHGSRKQAS